MKQTIIKTFITLAMLFYTSASFAVNDKMDLNYDFSRQINHIEIPSPAKPAVNSLETGRDKTADFENPIKNFGTVGEWMYRGARLTNESHYKFLKNLGITTVIDMQWPLRDNRDLCKKYDLDCIYTPVILIPEIDLYFDIKSLKKTFKRMIDEFKLGKTLYIHCHFGSDRTGILAAAFTIRQSMCNAKNPNETILQEKTMKSVEADLLKYGYNKTYQKPLKEMKTWLTEFNQNKNWLCQ